jgi:hypothetical protein
VPLQPAEQVRHTTSLIYLQTASVALDVPAVKKCVRFLPYKEQQLPVVGLSCISGLGTSEPAPENAPDLLVLAAAQKDLCTFKSQLMTAAKHAAACSDPVIMLGTQRSKKKNKVYNYYAAYALLAGASLDVQSLEYSCTAHLMLIMQILSTVRLFLYLSHRLL